MPAFQAVGQAVPLVLGQVVRACAKDVADSVERVVLVPVVAQGVLLDAAADLVQHLPGELDDVERVQHGGAAPSWSRSVFAWPTRDGIACATDWPSCSSHEAVIGVTVAVMITYDRPRLAARRPMSLPLIGLLAATLIVTTGTAANAADPNGAADNLAEMITDVAPEIDVVEPENTGEALLAEVGGDETVAIPASGSGAVTMTSESVFIQIELPQEAAGAAAVIADDGTVVYDQARSSVDVAVQAIEGGVRLQTILNDQGAPGEFTYDFPGTIPVLNADGSVTLTMDLDVGVAEVAELEAAWAFDADGLPVPTRYRVEGSAVVQEVDHTTGQFSYPIVADPTPGFGLGVYLFYNHAETKTIAGMGWGATGAAAVCASLGLMGGPVGAAAFGAACLIQAGSIVYTAGVAENSSPKSCLRLRYFLNALTPATYRDSRCS